MVNARQNPYVGPRPFAADETLPARDQEVRELRRILIGERIVVLHSPSGAGKTSLLTAKNGLLTEMKARGFTIRPVVRVSQAPPATLAGHVNRYEFSVLQSLALDDDDDDITLNAWANRRLSHYLDARKVELPGDEADDDPRVLVRRRELLVFDQFEEVLTTDPADDRGRTEFFEQLAVVLKDMHRWALFVLREDYLGALEPWARMLPTHLARRHRIDLLGVKAAERAIAEPAEVSGVAFAADALALLIEELSRITVQGLDGATITSAGPWIEPVQLQVVCHRLWSLLGSEKVLVERGDVKDLGDVDAALATFYADRVAAIAARTQVPERRIRGWIGTNLISPQGIRMQVLRGADTSDGLKNEAIEALAAAHLVRGEERRGAKWFELSHDRLVAPVRADNDAWERQNLHPIQLQATLWLQQGERAEFLLSYDALALAEPWLADNAAALTDDENVYLQRSRDAVAQRARELRTFKIGAAILGVLLCAAVGLGVFAGFKSNEAERNEEEALQSAYEAWRNETRALAATKEANEATRVARDEAARARAADRRARDWGLITATHQVAGDATVTAALLREVERPDQAPGWREGVDGLMSERIALRVLESPWRFVDRSALMMGRRDEGLVVPAGVQWSSSGARVLVDTSAGPSVWTIDGGAPVVLSPPDIVRDVHRGEFSPEGRYVLAVYSDRTIRVWELTRPGAPLPCELPGLRRPGERDVVFSPDERRLFVETDEGVESWDLAGGCTRGRLYEVKEELESLGVSGDGRYLVFVKDDKVQVRRVDGADTPRTFDPRDFVTSAALSHDGSRMVNTHYFGFARVWETSAGRRLGAPLRLVPEEYGTSFPEAAAFPKAAAFVGDGSRLLTLNDDGDVIAWTHDGAEWRRPLQVASAQVSNFRDLLPTLARQADVARTRGVKRPIVADLANRAVAATVLSPDARSQLTLDRDGARIWRIEPTIPYVDLLAPGEDISAGEFSPGGAHVLTYSRQSDTARLWSLDGDASPVVFTEAGRSAAFSRDGTRVLTLANNGTIQLWPADGVGRPVVVKKGGDAHQTATVRLSPDGTQVLSFSRRGAELRSIDSGKIRELAADGATISGAAFSDDGARVVVLAMDVKVFTTGGSDEPTRIERGDGPVFVEAQLSPDGTRVVTQSQDGSLKLWPLEDLGRAFELSHDLKAASLRAATAAGRAVSLSLVGDRPVARFSGDGKRILGPSGGAHVWVWQTDGSGEPAAFSDGSQEIRAAALSPDGSHLLTVSAMGVRIWSIDDPTDVVLSTWGVVLGALFSPDGTRVWVASDERVMVHRADGSGLPIVLDHERAAGKPMILAPDGERVLRPLAGRDARVWNFPGDLRSALWRQTTYCLPPERREELLFESQAEAAERHAECRAKVASYAPREGPSLADMWRVEPAG